MALGLHIKKLSFTHVARAICAVALIISGSLIYNRMFLVTEYSTTIDPLLTTQMHIALEQQIEKSNWRHNPHGIAQTLQSTFNCIKKVTTRLVPPSNLLITIEAEQPLLAVNNNYVITASGTIISDSPFLRQRVLALPHIRMQNLDEKAPLLSHELQLCLKTLPNTLLTSYAITIESDTSIWLSDLNMPVDILATIATIPNEQLLSQCNHIVESVAHQEAPNTHNAHRWIADIRFYKQIIVSKKGGHTHG